MLFELPLMVRNNNIVVQHTRTIVQPNLLGCRLSIDKHTFKYYNVAFILNCYPVMSQITIKISYILDTYFDLCPFLTSSECVPI